MKSNVSVNADCDKRKRLNQNKLINIKCSDKRKVKEINMCSIYLIYPVIGTSLITSLTSVTS